MKIGFIVGKKDDTVADKFYNSVADLPTKYQPKIRGNPVIPVDAAIAWYIHKKYNVDVDILKPNTLTKKNLLENNINFPLGFDYLDAKWSRKKGLDKLFKQILYYKKYHVAPSWKLQNFVYNKGLYLKYLESKEIPIAPTLLVKSKRSDYSTRSIKAIIKQIIKNQWAMFIIKPDGGMESKLVLKLHITDVNLVKKLSLYLNQNRKKFPRFIFQEAMKGFLKYPEIRTFWFNEKFAYSIGTIDSAPVPPRKTGEEKVIPVPKNSLRVCKAIARKVLKVIPKERYKGKNLKPVMVRIDFGCCQGNSLNKLKYFVNEVELQTAGLYSNFTNYSIVPKLAELFVKRAELLTGKKIKKRSKRKKKSPKKKKPSKRKSPKKN